MSRSPLSYPLNRGADTDVGGAADLQTDVMRFMAILSLCLVAIFALVQSLPMRPAEPVADRPVAPVTAIAAPARPAAAEPDLPQPEASAEQPPAEPKAVQLTRPVWVPQHLPTEKSADVAEEPPAAAPITAPPMAPAEGFTLRFASDLALTRLVAAGHVGVYAITDQRALRMTVAESRISFWDASTPNSFHEMDQATVPQAALAALARTGAETSDVSWGVTLPGKLKAELDKLLEMHSGGSLVITADGSIQLEQS